MATGPETSRATGRVRRAILVVALVGSVVGVADQDVAGAHPPPGGEVTATLVQTLDTSTLVPASPDPSGITFDSTSGDLVVTDGEINEYPYYEPDRVNTWHLTTAAPPAVTATGTTLIFSHLACTSPPGPPCPTPDDWSSEPTGVTYSASRDRFFTVDDVSDDLYTIDPGADGRLGTADDAHEDTIAVSSYGSGDPEGVTYNADLDVLHVADGVDETIYTVDPDTGALISTFSCATHGCANPEGIAWSSTTGRLAVLSASGSQKVQEFTTNGIHLRDIDISAAALENPAGLTWGPGSGGGTSLWVVDRGIDTNDGLPKDGQLFEFTVPAIPATPDLLVIPDTTLPFGDVLVGGAPSVAPVSLVNAGGAALTGTATLTAGGPDFSMTPSGGFALDPGEVLDLSVTFDPSVGSSPAIPYAGTVTITSTGGGATVSLTGGGFTPMPDISVAPMPAAFGDVGVTFLKDVTVTVTNDGTDSLSVTSTVMTGDPEFTLESGGGAFVLAPGATRDLVVRFEPTANAPFGGNLAVTSDDPDEGLVNVALSGQGVDGVVDVSVPTAVSFAPVVVGQQGETTLRVTNSGTATLTVTNLVLTGDPEFSLVPESLPSSLNVGEFRDLRLRLDPATLGVYSGDLAVTTDAGTRHAEIAGNGVAPLSCSTAPTPFTDVPATSFAALDVRCIFGFGVTKGTSATTYSPGDLVTREQMAAFLARVFAVLVGAPCPTPPTPFTDVPATSFAALDVRCIYGLGVTTGTSATTYSPGDFVTREQMAAFLSRLFRALTGRFHPETAHPFTDLSPTSFAFLDVGRLFDLGITTGTSATTYSPGDFVTREQMAAFLARLIRLLTQPPGGSLSSGGAR